jgi:hypothetical protein|mmetsp:Transcript_41505/g.65845  ORF Transcript_41505/g.65845 Transcript_41505/m.65845 type:complete len:98 (+) Transcript_41505:596-889(+)
MRRNKPEEPEACEPKEFACPEADRSLSSDFDEPPDDPPDEDNTLDSIEPELFQPPELKLIEFAESHAVYVVVLVGGARSGGVANETCKIPMKMATAP